MKATRLPNGMFEVESERDPDKSYFVNLGETPSCTCPHHAYRQARCKHIAAADALVASEKIRGRFLTASRVPDALLPALLEKHADDAAITTALLFERERRARAEAENEARLALFR